MCMSIVDWISSSSFFGSSPLKWSWVGLHSKLLRENDFIAYSYFHESSTFLAVG